MIFDTHAHYDDEAFDADREELLASLADNGIGNVVNVAASMRGCHATLELTERYDFVTDLPRQIWITLSSRQHRAVRLLP